VGRPTYFDAGRLREKNLGWWKDTATHHVRVKEQRHDTDGTDSGRLTRRPVSVQSADHQRDDVTSDVIVTRLAQQHTHVLQQVGFGLQ